MKLPHRITREEVSELARTLTALLSAPDSNTIVLDFAAVQRVDAAGVAVLCSFADDAERAGKALQMVGLTPEIERTLRLFPTVAPKTKPKPVTLDLQQRFGQGAYDAFLIGLQYLVLCADVAWFTVSDLWARKIAWRTVSFEMASMGSRAFGVVALIAFLVGGTMALQSAAQLRQFGANIFVADLVGISITRELGPLITAIVVAGRSGSAVAAELATMTITEEVDALHVMGINPTRFLVVPKVLAISITQPLLTAFANLAAITGGFLVAITYLEIGPMSFLNRLEQAMQVKDLLTGLFKSLLFANLIVTIGALCGVRTRGGADAVGRSTTTSVVASIFAVIVADAVCSLVFYF